MQTSELLYFVTIEVAFTILVALLCASVFAAIGIYMSTSAVESCAELQNDNRNCSPIAQTTTN